MAECNCSVQDIQVEAMGTTKVTFLHAGVPYQLQYIHIAIYLYNSSSKYLRAFANSFNSVVLAKTNKEFLTGEFCYCTVEDDIISINGGCSLYVPVPSVFEGLYP